jgi:zinc transport system substrate-binding protein
MKLKHILLVLLLSLSSFLVGCTAKEESTQEETKTESTVTEKLKIYTTIFPLEDFAKKIGGEHVEVISILPAGADGHTFEPTAKTMVEIAEADAFIYTGAGIEGFAEAATEALQNENVKIIKAAEGIELSTLEEHSDKGEAGHDEHEDEATHDEHESDAGHDEHEDEATHDKHEGDAGHDKHEDEATHDEHEHGDFDPHVWLDPILAMQLAENILHVLEELNPEAKADFEKNYNDLKQGLEELDHEFKEVVGNATKKEILVSHAAYGYWESRYGIEQISVTGLSPTNEPSQQDIQNIIETAEQYEIKYVIFEQNVSTKIAEIVRNEIKAETLTLHNLETITEEEAKNNEDYFSMMRRNLETLKTALN